MNEKSIELTTMCAIVHQNKVLMIKRRKNWCGWAFPGGHLEAGESVGECIRREMLEETGLVINSIQYKGIVHFFDTQYGKRHIITNFVCSDFEGIQKVECDEGKIEWIEKERINEKNLAEGMEYRLPLFLEEGVKELYIEWDQKNGYTKVKCFEYEV